MFKFIVPYNKCRLQWDYYVKLHTKHAKNTFVTNQRSIYFLNYLLYKKKNELKVIIIYLNVS